MPGQWTIWPRGRQAYEHPRHVLDGVRSILMLGLPYRTGEPQPAGAGQGRISRYAWGAGDYHDVIHDRLKRLIAAVTGLVPAAKARGVVDTAPLLEREFAQLAGLGWVGKHTLLINKPAGSYFFLAALLTDQELAYDEPFTADHCGTCRACLDACPTQGLSAALCARCDALHQLPDDRAARSDSRRAAAGHRRLALRLRRVPGRLSVESEGRVARLPHPNPLPKREGASDSPPLPTPIPSI